MTFNLYNDVKRFHKDTYDIFMCHEAQNVIPLGNIIIGNDGKDKTDWRDPAKWFMATVSDDTAILLTAVMTPPYNLTLYATDNMNDEAALYCLISGLTESDVHIPGIMAEKSLAELFAKLYSEKCMINYTVRTNQRIYELSEVNPDTLKYETVRLATEMDMSFLPYWIRGFYGDCFGDSLKTGSDIESYLYTLNRLYILEDDGMPVTMAKISRELQTVCVVGFVYTPPYFRRKGYATSCVAAVSKIGLDRGFKKCVLYTDLDNPTSNNIYMKIGYTPICDSLEIKLY